MGRCTGTAGPDDSLSPSHPPHTRGHNGTINSAAKPVCCYIRSGSMVTAMPTVAAMGRPTVAAMGRPTVAVMDRPTVAVMDRTTVAAMGRCTVVVMGRCSVTAMGRQSYRSPVLMCALQLSFHHSFHQSAYNGRSLLRRVGSSVGQSTPGARRRTAG